MTPPRTRPKAPAEPVDADAVSAQEAAGAPESAPASADTNPSPNGWQEPTQAVQTIPATDPVLEALKALRAPFPPEAIGKLPRSTCKACADMARQYRACESHTFLRRCDACGGNHSSATMHLDFVGHADVTARLLEVDPRWTWTPFSAEQISALPPAVRDGGLWINLTVAGVTRPGFGDAQGKTGGNAVKEMIGDALRNAAMRFGVSLDLWAKGDRSWAKAEDETPEDQVADASAARQTRDEVAPGARGSMQDRHVHTRHEALDDMTREQMPAPDRRRWDTHMATFMDDWKALPEAVQANVKANWPKDVPTPASGRMTINEIKAARDYMAEMLKDSLVPAETAPAAEPDQPTLGAGEDEPPF